MFEESDVNGAKTIGKIVKVVPLLLVSISLSSPCSKNVNSLKYLVHRYCSVNT